MKPRRTLMMLTMLERLIAGLDDPDQSLGLPEVYQNRVAIHPAAFRR